MKKVTKKWKLLFVICHRVLNTFHTRNSCKTTHIPITFYTNVVQVVIAWISEKRIVLKD